ncbi:MAG: radical SAM protein [Thermoanaerobaculia bacterium]
MSRTRIAHAAALARDWAGGGDALAQWTHFVTSTCNAKCAHCFYPINQKTNELTLDEIDRLASTLPPIRLLLISGGEPFLRRDLPEIIRVYFERTRFFTASIPTNGYAPEATCRAAEAICGISPDLSLGITVSIDGFKEFHDRVRGVPGLYERSLATLEALLAVTKRLPNLTVGVTTVFMKDNQEEIDRFVDFIWERYRPNHHAIGLIRGNPLDPSLKQDLDIDRYERVSRTVDSRYPPDEVRTGWRGLRVRARREINRQRAEYIARQARGGGFEGFCHAGEREFVLSEDGDVFGCELIPQKLGNVREAGYDFAKIRDGAAAAEFNRAKHERECRCTHECNVRTMLLFNRQNAIPLIGAMLGLARGTRG